MNDLADRPPVPYAAADAGDAAADRVDGPAAPVDMPAAGAAAPADTVRRVVGLASERGTSTPQVVLKGAGPLAERILAERRARGGPPVIRNEALLQSLYRLPLDAQIGPELFHVVAVILAHVFAIEARARQERNG